MPPNAESKKTRANSNQASVDNNNNYKVEDEKILRTTALAM